MDRPHILIVAGDASADRHGAALLQALRAREPRVRVSALGGVHLRKETDRFLYPLVGVGGFGFWEPLLKLPQLWSAWKAIKNVLGKDRPDLVLPMDYYGFNIHVARRARAAGIPVVYYISPQVWASRPQRIQRLAQAVSKMLVIFPVEVELYRSAGVPVSFVGHPLLECVPAPYDPAQPPHIGFLPGSRRGTVERHLPLMIAAAEQLRQDFPEAQFLLFRPVEVEPSVYAPFLKNTPWMRLVADPGYAERKQLSLAISVSGTAALENMLLGIPMILMYRLSKLTYAIARRVIRIPFVGIPNILAGKPLVPELLQERATPDGLAQAAKTLLKDAARWRQTRQELLRLRQQLAGGGSQKAAEEILQSLRDTIQRDNIPTPTPLPEAV